MPPRKVRDKETGDILTIEAPEGASNEEIIGLARRQASTKALGRREPTTRSEGLDAVGRAKRWLVRPEQEVPAEQQRLPGQIVRAAGDLFIPESLPDLYRTAATLPIGGGMVTGPLKRVAAGALAGGGAKLAQTGGDLWAAGKEAVGSGLSQFAGELLPGALRFGATQQAARRPIAKAAHDRAMHETLTEADKKSHGEAIAATEAADKARGTEARARYEETKRDTLRAHKDAEAAQKRQHATEVESAKTAHAAAVRDYEQRGAKTIADAYKDQVPAWRGFPSDESGLVAMVYSPKGQALVRERFDEALRDVISLGAGKKIAVLADDAAALRLRPVGRIDVGAGMPPQVWVDAGQAAGNVTGRWKRNTGLYRRVVDALDAADIGDPAARAEYKAAQALTQFADKTQMLKGERFNADAALSGFTKLKTVDELRRRGSGGAQAGPIYEAARTGRPAPLQLPPEPAPLELPRVGAYRPPTPSPLPPQPPQRQAPPTAKDLGVETASVPEIGFFGGAMLAEVPFLLGGLAMGHQGYHGYGLPAVAGGLTARGLGGRTFATKAPLTPAAKLATELLPPALAQETSHLTRGARPQPLTLRPSEVSPETQRLAEAEYARTRGSRPEDPSAP